MNELAISEVRDYLDRNNDTITVKVELKELVEIDNETVEALIRDNFYIGLNSWMELDFGYSGFSITIAENKQQLTNAEPKYEVEYIDIPKDILENYIDGIIHKEVN